MDYVEAIGRRRESTARVRLYYLIGKKETTVHGVMLRKGLSMVNGKSADDYFKNKLWLLRFYAPLMLTGTKDTGAISVKVEGCGQIGQLEACIHGISRVLDKVDKGKYHDTLRKHNLLTRDPRAKERRKAGFAQKARARKQSPKR